MDDCGGNDATNRYTSPVSVMLPFQQDLLIINSCTPVIRILEHILISCQTAATLESAHKLLRILTANPKLSSLVDTTEMLDDVLEGIGFGGLWRSATFHSASDNDRQCTILTDRLIEVCLLYPTQTQPLS